MDSWDRRLGCAAKIVGQPLATSDNRRPQSNPHLRHSVGLALEVLDYLDQAAIRVFRLPSNFCPFATHPQHPQLAWQRQFAEAEQELALLRDKVAQTGVRLSFHPSQYVLLNSPRPEVTQSSVAELEWQARLLDELDCGAECRVLIHVGGVYDEREQAAARLLREIERLPEPVSRRLALENDDVSWGAAQVAELCQQSGLPMVFDFHHHACLNSGEPWMEMLQLALDSWGGLRPKTHLSSPKTDSTDPKLWKAPRLRQHSDYIDPFAWLRIRAACEQRRLSEFDVMLEAKAKDLAVLKLRADSARVAGALLAAP